jgi:hypothetical protein
MPGEVVAEGRARAKRHDETLPESGVRADLAAELRLALGDAREAGEREVRIGRHGERGEQFLVLRRGKLVKDPGRP